MVPLGRLWGAEGGFLPLDLVPHSPPPAHLDGLAPALGRVSHALCASGGSDDLAQASPWRWVCGRRRKRPRRRTMEIAALARQARFRGSAPLRIRDRSSSQEKSRTYWRRFSSSQRPRFRAGMSTGPARSGPSEVRPRTASAAVFPVWITVRRGRRGASGGVPVGARGRWGVRRGARARRSAPRPARGPRRVCAPSARRLRCLGGREAP